MSAYSLKHRLCFLHIPKNGGTAIRRSLAKMADDLRDFDEIDKRFRARRDPAFANHLPLARIMGLAERPGVYIPLGAGGNSLRCFTVVRNPWARMVSLYNHRLRKLHLSVDGKPRNTPEDIKVAKAGFVPWLLSTPNAGDKVLTRTPQLHWVDPNIDRVRFLRFERLTMEWLDLIEEWSLPYAPLARVNQGPKTDYRVHYDAEARNHVAKYFARDIERFGYDFL